MSVYSVFFSPTGGTKKVLDYLTAELPVDLKIDLSSPDTDYSAYSFSKDDVCLIGVPSFGGRVPHIALDRIRRMQGNGALAIPVVVYGNRAYDDTLLELKNEAEVCGFLVVAAVAAVAEHSIMRQYAQGRPDSQDEMELRQFSKQISEAIAGRESVKDIAVPGTSPYREYGGVPLKPKSNKDCAKCGLCAEKCPVGAIPENEPALLNEAKCVSCMRCIAICPQSARKLNKAILFAASQSMKKAFAGRKENELYL